MFRAWVVFLIAASFLSTALAQQPKTLGYQARLTTSAGAPVNGSQTINFALYATPTGGSALWTESQSVVLANGDLSVTLGELTALPEALFNGPLYLGITVGGDVEMTPRPKLNASPFAIKARGTLARTIEVPATGTQLQNGAALKAAIAGIAPGSTQITIRLDSGPYDLGADQLSLGAQWSLIGSGPEATRLFSSHETAAVEIAGASVSVKDLLISNYGAGPATNVDGAAAIRIRDGAISARLSNLIVQSEVASATTGIRNAIWIESNSPQITDVNVFARGGAATRAIYGTGHNARMVLTNVIAQANSTATSTEAIGAFFVDRPDLVISGGRYLGVGVGSNNIGLQLTRSGGSIEGGQILAANSGASGTRKGLSIIEPRFLLVLSARIQADSSAGSATLNIAVDMSGNSSHSVVEFQHCDIRTGGSPELTALRSAGLAPVIVGGSVTAFGSASATRVVAIELLPPPTGSQQVGTQLNGVRIRQGHGAGVDVGAAIITTSDNIEIDNTVVRSIDDGVEAGISGNAANLSGFVNLSNSRVSAGLRSIRKHQNWGFTLRNSVINNSILAEGGGLVACFGTTHSVGGVQFLPTGCPTAP